MPSRSPHRTATGLIPARACGAAKTTTPLSSTNAERWAIRPNDVLLDVPYHCVCHSDIHQVCDEWKDWDPTVYPTQPFANVLEPDSTLVNVGAMEELKGVKGINLTYARKSIAGSMIGGIAETQQVINYCSRPKHQGRHRTDPARPDQPSLRASREKGRAATAPSSTRPR